MTKEAASSHRRPDPIKNQAKSAACIGQQLEKSNSWFTMGGESEHYPSYVVLEIFTTFDDPRYTTFRIFLVKMSCLRMQYICLNPIKMQAL